MKFARSAAQASLQPALQIVPIAYKGYILIDLLTTADMRLALFMPPLCGIRVRISTSKVALGVDSRTAVSSEGQMLEVSNLTICDLRFMSLSVML
jgi:hypothetical protein